MEEMYSVFSVSRDNLSGLDAKQAVELVEDLLFAESFRKGLPFSNINVSRNVNVADGGVDARVSVIEGHFVDGLIKQGLTTYQIKSGKFSPWQKSEIINELFTNSEISV